MAPYQECHLLPARTLLDQIPKIFSDLRRGERTEGTAGSLGLLLFCQSPPPPSMVHHNPGRQSLVKTDLWSRSSQDGVTGTLMDTDAVSFLWWCMCLLWGMCRPCGLVSGEQHRRCTVLTALVVTVSEPEPMAKRVTPALSLLKASFPVPWNMPCSDTRDT